MIELLKRFKERWKDKELAEKCGLEVKDVCVHEDDGRCHIQQRSEVVETRVSKCKKCGEFYR